MILRSMRLTKHVLVLPALLVCSRILAAQVSPTPTVTEGDPNYAYDWAQWLNSQMPQAVPQETISLGGVQWPSLAGAPTGIPGEYGAHMTWNGLPTMQTSSTCSPLVPQGTNVQAPVVQINSYNEQYQIIIAQPDPGYSPNGLDTPLHPMQLKVILTVPTLGGGSEVYNATLQQFSDQSLFPGAIQATIAFHPRTSLPQRLDISWYASLAVSPGVGGVVGTGPGGTPVMSAPPEQKAAACYTIIPYLKPQLGGFVVPYLPVTIVYQPVGCGTVPTSNPDVPSVVAGSSAVFTTTAQVGTTFSWGNLSTSGSIQTDNSADFLQHVKDGTDVASFVIGLIPGGQPVADALDKVGKVADALNKILPNTQTTITSTSTQGHTETQGWVTSSSQGYGTQLCDSEDRYVYMRNVLFAYAVVPKDPVSKQFTPTGIPTVVLAPIHFDAPVNADLLSDLRRNVPAAVLAQFLALRAQGPKQISKGGNNQAPLQSPIPSLSAGFKNLGLPPRLVPWPPGADINESVENCYVDAPNFIDYGKQSIVSYEQSQATTTTTVSQVSGLIAQWMGKVGETTQSLTISGAKNNWLSYGTDSKVTLQCPEIAPAYYAREMDVWFDTVMGTLLAVPNGILVPYGQQPQIQGNCSPNTDVVLKIGGKRYRVRSDTKGNFAFRFASIPRGAGSLVAGNQMLPINYNGTPLVNRNFKNSSGMVASSIAGKTIVGTKLSDAVSSPIPCCPITSIDPATGAVAARVNGTGQSFQFTVKDSALLHALKIGQAVFANFKTRQVSVDGKDVCCQIVSLATLKPGPIAPATVGTPVNQNPAGQARPSGACCQVTAINQQTGIVTGKVNATGQTFEFKASPPVLPSLRIGEALYANLTKRQVSLDGKTMCCVIVAVSQTPPRSGAPPASR